MAVRITGGNLRGRLLRVPAGPVRPTQDRVRAALFSMLGDRVHGANVLDLFAGTGALGLEAYSRGAARVVWVESHRRVWLMLRENVRNLAGLDPGGGWPAAAQSGALTCVCADAMRFPRGLMARPAGLEFDLVFADPPYTEAAAIGKNLLHALAQGAMLSSRACLALEQSTAAPPAECVDWELWRLRDYGKTRICLYRRGMAGEGEGFAQSGDISGDV